MMPNDPPGWINTNDLLFPALSPIGSGEAGRVGGLGGEIGTDTPQIPYTESFT